MSAWSTLSRRKGVTPAAAERPSALADAGLGKMSSRHQVESSSLSAPNGSITKRCCSSQASLAEPSSILLSNAARALDHIRYHCRQSVHNGVAKYTADFLNMEFDFAQFAFCKVSASATFSSVLDASNSAHSSLIEYHGKLVSRTVRAHDIIRDHCLHVLLDKSPRRKSRSTRVSVPR